MTHELNDFDSFSLRWPLAATLCLTGLIAAEVCTRPVVPLHSWGQLFGRASAYLLVAAIIHILAIWGIYRIPGFERAKATSQVIWPTIRTLWIAIVWLPLLAVLTSEHSLWVAFILPLTAVLATLVAVPRQPQSPHLDDDVLPSPARHELFATPAEQPLWRRLLPILIAALSLELGVALLIATHAWIAGLLFASSGAWLTHRAFGSTSARYSSRRVSAGNSLTVWLLIALALTPFLIGMGSMVSHWLGMDAVHASSRYTHPAGYRAGWGYTSIVLLTPPKPHELVTPTPTPTHEPSTFSKPRVILFDGAYWYFQMPKTQPSPRAHVVQGDPQKANIRSTDMLPLEMEAHQPLGQVISMSCCRALQVEVLNGDAIPGAIALQVSVREASSKTKHMLSLGHKILPSSIVTPMPLHRAPVDETLTFPFPKTHTGKSFDEITVSIVADRQRSLAGPRVSIKQFTLEP